MGRREERKAERCGAILDVAHRSFLALGYDRTTMSAIAEIMGGSKGTLWSYFGSKEELFEAVVDLAVFNFRADLVAALASNGSFRGVLVGFAETFIRKITDPDAIALQRLIVGECPRFREIGSIFCARGPGVTREVVSTFIGERMKAGALVEGDPAKAAHMLRSLRSGGLHQRVLWGIDVASETEIRSEAGVAADFFLQVFGTSDD